MPKENTHLHFAKTTKNYSPDILEIIDRNLEYFYLGSVSPDTLFYSKKAHIKDVADYIHGRDGNLTNIFVFDLLDEARQTKNEKLLTFVFGMLTHINLDIVFHPVIFYLTGNYHHKDEDKRMKAIYRHRRYEVALDKRLNDSSYFEDMISKKVFKDKDLIDAISRSLNISKKDVQLSFERQLFMHKYIFKLFKFLCNKLGLNNKNELAFFYGDLEDDCECNDEIEYADLITGEKFKKNINELLTHADKRTKLSISSAYRYYKGIETKVQAEGYISGESLDVGVKNLSVHEIKFVKE